MVFVGPTSSIFDYATYGMMLYVFDCWNNPSLFQTEWFVEISFDPNPDHPYHQDSEDSVRGEPCEPLVDCDDGHHLHGGNDVALHLGGFSIGFRAAAFSLLAAGCGHASDRRITHSPCENLVHPKMGTLKRRMVRRFGYRFREARPNAIGEMWPSTRPLAAAGGTRAAVREIDFARFLELEAMFRPLEHDLASDTGIRSNSTGALRSRSPDRVWTTDRRRSTLLRRADRRSIAIACLSSGKLAAEG